MNTIKSFWVGWGSLCVAGGAAYYFAKKSINEDRAARFEADQKRRRVQESLERSANINNKQSSSSAGNSPMKNNGGPARADSSGSPSQEATILDPAPTGHAPNTEGERIREKSKYETSEPFRSKKGDRFS